MTANVTIPENIGLTPEQIVEKKVTELEKAGVKFDEQKALVDRLKASKESPEIPKLSEEEKLKLIKELSEVERKASKEKSNDLRTIP